jgi:hypothetical protein
VLTGYLSLRHGLAVTGRIRNNGQNLLQSYFQTGTKSRLSYFHIFFLIEFFEELFASNIVIIIIIIIIICINYIIIIWVNENNAVINNNCGRLQNLILVLNIPMSTRKVFFDI